MKKLTRAILALIIALFGSACTTTQSIQDKNLFAFNENNHDELLVMNCISKEGYLDDNCYLGTENRRGIPVSIKTPKRIMPPLEALECLQKNGDFEIECL
jgi:hypothetical protein